MFKLSRISRTELLAARSADFAVDFDGPALHQLFGLAARLAQTGELQKGVKLNKVGDNPVVANTLFNGVTRKACNKSE